ncbi:hypothetical protein GETHLI_32680 [Geothrix limicola]|uniref:Uncharacterized protein n=1 Tax=Geothrix limicola TaxID=2927978 RepID=A0ABQ5QK82_9BACT|nr:hypothetical protein GETHLI_32680 [Geothrix limicola]
MSSGPTTKAKKQPKSHDQMYRCEIKKKFIEGETKVYRWTEVNVSDIPGRPKARCVHCKGAVRLHFKRQAHGTPDHCEHKLRQDSTHCEAGHYFEGVHQESLSPVE